jgi:hypothetical protein
MAGSRLAFVVAGLLLTAGCSGSGSGSGSGDGDGDGDSRGGSAGTSSQAGTGGNAGGSVDCSNVGCAPPPLCADGCSETCGCCSCADGEIIERTGTSYRCEGGCYAPLESQGVDWVRLQIDEGWGPCPGDEICAEQWIARPGGSVETTKDGVMASATMPAADREALEVVIADPAFLSGMMSGFSCGIPPSDVAYNMTLELADGEYVEDVTGCVLGGPAGNPAERAVELLSKY